ncbi:MAG: ribbon-helix-helix protein, CopG family [Proteobacteria bacterium]|nr:ribbon-helix-helix protein, CopG family [Pseudomonadota bacterium]
MKKDTITFRLDQDKKKILDAIAATMERDRAYVLNEAVEEFIELHQWQFAHIQKGIEEADKEKFATEDEIRTAFKKWTK